MYKDALDLRQHRLMFLSPSKQWLARALKSIFIGGLIAGILDLIAAFVSAWLRSGTTPRRVTLFIASGALGPAAFTGGNKTVALGVAFRFDRDRRGRGFLSRQS